MPSIYNLAAAPLPLYPQLILSFLPPMESSLSLAPQAFAFVTRSPVFSPLPCRAVGLRRSEFINNGHNLRLPWRRCKKLRLKSESPNCKFLFKASLDSQSILVVATAVAAVSAMTVVYVTYSRKQFDIKQMSERLTLALSEQIRSMTSWILTDSHHVSSKKTESIDGDKYIMNESMKSKGAEIMFTETDVILGGDLIAEASTFQSNILASNVHDSIISLTSATSEISSVLSEYDISPFVEEVCEVHPNVHEHSNSVASELSVPVMPRKLGDSTSSVDNKEEETDDLGGMNCEHLKENNINNLFLIFQDSARKELHTITEASLEKLDSVELLSSCATLQKNGNYSYFKNNSLAEGSNHTAHNIVLPIEKLEGERPLGYYSQGFLCQQKDSTNRKGLRNQGKNISDSLRNLPPSSDPNQKHHDNKHNPPWQLRVYNQLLREDRLNDCIQLLEDLEEQGLLDMDKVYHARFFDVCKRQKAVKVAFRFAKLIPNPTLSTFNMLMSVCASSQDSEGAFQVLQHVQEAGLKADCKLYTTLISTCAKSGKVDTMFEVFHEMVNAGVEPNVHTYGALIDGCAKAGQVAKAFGAYGILRSKKNVEPDRVVFNALITACGQSGAVDRAFDVLAEMKAETHPIDPDHVTVGALMKACARSGQVDRAREVYDIIRQYNIRGTAELYTIAINSCCHGGDWEFACSVYDDMIRKGVVPDEMFISALIDVAGHAGKVDAAFEILHEARAKGMHVGIISYSSLMGACSKARDWQKALKLYENIKKLNLRPTVSLMNALITALSDADQLQKAMEILVEMKSIGLCPNTITYSILFVASEKKDDLETGLMLFSQAKEDAVAPNLVMCRCLIAMCLRRFQTDSKFGEPVLAFTSGRVQLNSKWTSLVLTVYREAIVAGVALTMDEFSLVLGCLKLPHDVSVRKRLVENLGYNIGASKGANFYSLIDGFGEYDPRALYLVEEATSLGVIPFVSLKESPVVVDARNFQLHTAEVYLLTVLKGLKNRFAAGAKVPNLTILLPVETAQIQTSSGEKTISIAGRISQAVAALLRRLGLSYQGNESYGKIRVNGITIRKWFQPKRDSSFHERTLELSPFLGHLGSGISRQQRKIRTGHLSLE